eukprot:TRINITY_DN1094_c0_g1_i1.p1 TRINITY_DN1094_c0_g1~~TRINITY_DN1094_c0_g1_i1.p1  ORF type:complete len:369 (+),score=64.18 TRINITY_DN1094_c0_g1_i1:154-1260(+)
MIPSSSESPPTPPATPPPRTQRADERCLQQIAALATVNAEILQRIHSSAEETERKIPVSRQLQLVYDAEHLPRVEVTVSSLSPAGIVASWKPGSPPQFVATAEMNLFNDNVDYTVEGVSDLQRLNETLPAVAQKFTWLDPLKSPPILQLYLQNMGLLQSLMGDLEAHLMGVDDEGIDEIESEVQAVATRLQELQTLVETRNAKYAFARRIEMSFNKQSLSGAHFATSDWRSFSKTSTGYTAITSAENYKSFEDLKFRYDSSCSSLGWFLVGVSPQVHTKAKPGENSVYGLNVALDSENTAVYRGGHLNLNQDFSARPGSVLSLHLDRDNSHLNVSCDAPSWSYAIKLPPVDINWYVYVNSYDVSFTLL